MVFLKRGFLKWSIHWIVWEIKIINVIQSTIAITKRKEVYNELVWMGIAVCICSAEIMALDKMPRYYVLNHANDLD